MLPSKKKKMARQMKENQIYCAKCDELMNEAVLPTYEYEEGYLLHNVLGYRCNKCRNVFFTEAQAKEMEMRTKSLKEQAFGFYRKITVSGRSLAITIPHELANHLGIKQGQKVKIMPLAKEGIVIKKSI